MVQETQRKRQAPASPPSIPPEKKMRQELDPEEFPFADLSFTGEVQEPAVAFPLQIYRPWDGGRGALLEQKRPLVYEEVRGGGRPEDWAKAFQVTFCEKLLEAEEFLRIPDLPWPEEIHRPLVFELTEVFPHPEKPDLYVFSNRKTGNTAEVPEETVAGVRTSLERVFRYQADKLRQDKVEICYTDDYYTDDEMEEISIKDLVTLARALCSLRRVLCSSRDHFLPGNFCQDLFLDGEESTLDRHTPLLLREKLYQERAGEFAEQFEEGDECAVTSLGYVLRNIADTCYLDFDVLDPDLYQEDKEKMKEYMRDLVNLLEVRLGLAEPRNVGAAVKWMREVPLAHFCYCAPPLDWQDPVSAEFGDQGMFQLVVKNRECFR